MKNKCQKCKYLRFYAFRGSEEQSTPYCLKKYRALSFGHPKLWRKYAKKCKDFNKGGVIY